LPIFHSGWHALTGVFNEAGVPQQDLSLLASVAFFIGTSKGVVDRTIAAQ
jgi:hypothetical protein